MQLYKDILNNGFLLKDCEKHYHEHDEAWLILAGKGTGYWIDPQGKREEFVLEKGDVWMIPVGYEHGSEGPNSEDFKIAVVHGVFPETCHSLGHYYVEKDGYIPSFEIKRTPTDRYKKHPDMPTEMKGLICPEKNKIVFQKEPVPTLEVGRVMCKTIYSGLTNGTERNVLTGGNYGKNYPNRCAYQNVGEVIALGQDAKGLKVGDVVFSGNFCQHVEYFTVDTRYFDTENNLTIKLGNDINPLHAALFGVASVAMHDVRRADIKLGEKTLVVGAGLIGMFTAQCLLAAGAEVTLCDVDQERLDVAKQCGIQNVFRIENENSWAVLKSKGLFDAIFEDSGADILSRFFGNGWGEAMIRTFGKIVLVAGREEIKYGFNVGQFCEVALLQASHFLLSDLKQVARLTAGGVIKIEPMIKDIVPIGKALDIYKRLKDDPGSLLGTVFKW